jgi:hypothetical protein
MVITASGEGSFAHGKITASYYPYNDDSILASGDGSTAFGWLYGFGYGYTPHIKAEGKGSLAFGKMDATGAWPGGIRATGDGCFSGGSSNGSGGGYIISSGEGNLAFGVTGPLSSVIASGNGSVAFGSVQTNSTIWSSGKGSFTAGYAKGYSITSSEIKATGRGASAFGYAYVGYIRASGRGSIAGGQSSTYKIVASGNGCLAFGVAYPGPYYSADCVASGESSVQFGAGTNAESLSLGVGQRGTGLRLCGLGAPASPVNGDLWLANNYVYVRSNGTSCKIANNPA